MKRLLPFLILLASVCGLRAANPSFDSFRGTNQVIVTSNATTGRIIIGPATPISTIASNAATALNLWTNHDGLIHVVNFGDFLVLGASTENQPYALYSVREATNYITSRFDYGPSGDGSRIAFYIDLNKSFAGGAPYFGQFLIGLEVDNFVDTTNSTLAMYYHQGSFGIVGDSYPIDFYSEAVGVLGAGEGASHLQIGVVGFTDGSYNGGTLVGQTNVGVIGTGARNGVTTTAVGGYFEIGNGYNETVEPAFVTAALIADSRDSGGIIFFGSTNNGTFRVIEIQGTKTTNAVPFDSAGIISGYAGLASYSTTATNQIPTTGWTNNATINVTVYTTATAVSFTINNRAGTVLYTSPTLTATMPVNLQPGWSIRAASGLTGTVLPN